MELIKIDKDWIPTEEGTSLYIRPFIFATEPFLGVHASMSYKFVIILSPVGAYYATGLNPVKIYVEDKYVRAVKGGMGYAKTGGNYAASLKAQDSATGYSQVLWLDGIDRKYIEEVGAMNVFFVIGDEVVTPELNGSILPGITRKSAIEIMKNWGLKVSERRLSIEEIEDAAKNGMLKEMFGTGTAAVISPVGELKYKDNAIIINDNKIGPISQKLYDNLTGIQWGKMEDKFGWSLNFKVNMIQLLSIKIYLNFYT
ncbi:MAG: branched-chain amino acid aminotransferase, partial [Oscillospiraceae bacterium]